jgi:dipeptidyl aminopeptidase/acylaminoacyl peptidase
MFKAFLGMFVALAVGVTGAISAPVEAYGRLPAMSGVDISANGQSLAYIVNEGGSSHIVIQGVDGTVAHSLNMGDRKVRSLSWVNDSHVIIQVSSTTGIPGVAFVGEYFQALSLNAKTGAIVQLPNGSEDSVLNVMWETPYGGAHDGKTVIWAGLYAKEAFADQDGHYDLYRMDPDTGIGRRHQMGDKETDSYLARPDGTVLARTRFRSRDGRWSLDLRRNGAWSEAYTVLAPLDHPSIEGLTYDESAVVLSIWNAETKRWANAPVSLADGKLGEPSAPDKPYDLITDGQNRIIGSTYEGVYREYDFTEPRIKATWAQVRQVFAGRQVVLSAHTPDFAKLVVYVEGTGEPGGYYLVDLAAKKIKRIGAAYPGLTGADIAQVQAIKYQAADGLEINGYLTLPNGKTAKGLPLIVLPHGGPQARDSAGFDWWAQALASRGYAVLQPNFRGSSGYGRAFTEAGYGEWGGKMQTDLSDGVRTLAKAGTIDPKRVCIVGGSYGGYAALAGITLDKGVYRCAVSVAGVSDMAKMLDKEISQGSNEGSAVRYWKRYMGVTSPSDPRLAQRSPVNFAAQADGPVLLIHGKDDTVVYFDQSTDMRRALEKAGKPVEFVTLKAEDHWLSREATRQQTLTSMVTFLERHNPPQ